MEMISIFYQQVMLSTFISITRRNVKTYAWRSPKTISKHGAVSKKTGVLKDNNDRRENNNNELKKRSDNNIADRISKFAGSVKKKSL